MKILILLLTLTLISCGKEKTCDGTTDTSGTVTFDKNYEVYGTNSGERVILFHGIYGDSSYFKAGAGKLLFDELITEGKQVVLISYPQTTGAFFKEGGKVYREKFKEFMDWLTSDLETTEGVATINTVGGFSFGGAHAIIAALDSEGYFDNFIVSAPALDIRNAIGSYKCYNNDYFNIYNEDVSSLDGFAAFGESDGVVNWQKGDVYLGSLGIQTKTYTGVTHTITSDQVTDIIDYLR